MTYVANSRTPVRRTDGWFLGALMGSPKGSLRSGPALAVMAAGLTVLAALTGASALVASSHLPATAAHPGGLRTALYSGPTVRTYDVARSTTTLALITTTGDLVVFGVIGGNDPGSPTASLSDSQGTFSSAAPSLGGVSDGNGWYYAAWTGSSAATGNDTFTITMSACPYTCDLFAADVAGASLEPGFVNGSNGQIVYLGGATSLTVVTAAPIAANSLVLVAGVNGADDVTSSDNGSLLQESNQGVTAFLWADSNAPGGRITETLTTGSVEPYGAFIVPIENTPAPPTVPGAPTRLVAASVSATAVGLAWTNPAGPLTDNHVYWSHGYTCSMLSSTDLGSVAMTYSATGLTPGSAYSFEVTANNSTGEGAPSACLPVTTLVTGMAPPAPTGLTATPVSPTEIDLAWANTPFQLEVTNTVGPIGAPNAISYDPARNAVYVSESTLDRVVSFSDSTSLILSNTSVGLIPSALAYDSGKGETFVANYGTTTVSVISDATNTVTATVTVGTSPRWVAYDSGTGTVYVANQGDDTVSVISDVTNTVTATVSVGSLPSGLAYDSADHTVFAANYGSNSLSVISDATNTVVHTVNMPGAGPYALAYDSALGEMWVADYTNDTVTVLSASTYAVLATVYVGPGSTPYALAYDSATGDVFVALPGGAKVSVLSDVTNAQITSLAVGFSPYGVAYDSGVAGAYIPNLASDNVSLIQRLFITDSHVYQSSGNACASPVATDLHAVATSYPATGLAIGVLYSFEVTVNNSAGESGFSACVNAATPGPPPAPTGVSAVPQAVSIDWSWTQAAGGGVLNDTVYLYLGWGCTGVGTGYSAGVAVVYTTGSLTAVAAYSATVTAWNASGQSPPSTCFNTTTTNYPPPPNNAQPNWFVWVIFGSVFALFAYIGFDWADRWMRRNRKGRVKAP